MREDVKSLPDGKREDLAVASAEVLCFLLSAEPEEAVFCTELTESFFRFARSFWRGNKISSLLRRRNFFSTVPTVHSVHSVLSESQKNVKTSVFSLDES